MSITTWLSIMEMVAGNARNSLAQTRVMNMVQVHGLD